MANVEHNTLTGAALHEPKGVAAAAANRVYVADGVGSGAWSTVPNAALADAAKAFQAQLLHVRETQSASTDAGTFTSGSWQTRLLNTEVTNEISGASLASNTITLPAGTYFIVARAPAHTNVQAHKAKLRNTTDGSDTIIGSNARMSSTEASTGMMSDSWVFGRFTIAGTKNFQLQHRCGTTVSGNGFGEESDFGVTEVYSEALIWKVA